MTKAINELITVGILTKKSNLMKASNNAYYITFILTSIEKQVFSVNAWGDFAFKIDELPIGSFIKIKAYLREYKDDRVGKYCYKISKTEGVVEELKTVQTISGTVSSTDVHIARGKGNKVFSLKSDCYSEHNLFHCIFPKDAPWVAFIEKGNSVIVTGTPVDAKNPTLNVEKVVKIKK